jgi:hypothetical protein
MVDRGVTMLAVGNARLRKELMNDVSLRPFQFGKGIGTGEFGHVYWGRDKASLVAITRPFEDCLEGLRSCTAF